MNPCPSASIVGRLKISIIIPAFNEALLLGATLDCVKPALEAFSRRGWETEIIVCDNNSTDATPEIARAAGASVVFEPINQIGRARNRGASAAAGDWLIFLDADSHPSVELMWDVADAIESGRCLAGGVTVRFDDNRVRARFFTGLWNLISRTWCLMAGSFIFCDAVAFRKIGGFSEELFAAEELDLSKRLKKLARETGKKVMILNRHPLMTSSRKLRLYTPGEHLRLVAKVLWNRRTLTRRDACILWYDGRR